MKYFLSMCPASLVLFVVSPDMGMSEMLMWSSFSSRGKGIFFYLRVAVTEGWEKLKDVLINYLTIPYLSVVQAATSQLQLS